MKKYYDILKQSVFFKNFTDEELSSVLSTLNCKTEMYCKGQMIFSQGEITNRCGIILSGSVFAESVSYGGNRRIISHLAKGDSFGDVLMSSKSHPTPVSIFAKENTYVLFVFFSDLISNAGNRLCLRALINMTNGLADKFWALNRKIAYISAKSMRAKISLFLLDMKRSHNALTFSVEYSRDELAALLAVNRSALSRELSRMQKEGIISFYKNTFKIENEIALKKYL